MRTNRRQFLGGVVASTTGSRALLTGSLPGLQATEVVRKQIRKILEEQQEAWNAGDVDGFLRGYWSSPELTFSGSNGTSRGWRAVRERYRQRYPNKMSMGTLAFSRLEIRELSTTAALVLGEWQLRRASGNVGGVFTLVFEEFTEGWRIVHDHTSTEESQSGCSKARARPTD